MASTGINSWMGHFKSNENINTITKKPSAVYDAETGKKKIADVKTGTKVTYLPSTSYSQRSLVEIEVNGKTFRCRIPIDNLAKPKSKSSGGVSLKPQAFGVTDKTYSIGEYVIDVLAELNKESSNIDPTTRTFISLLFKYCAMPKANRAKIADQLKSTFYTNKSILPINEINKDFGEVLGPVACYFDGLLKDSGGKIFLSKDVKILIPKKPNEPLMDYKLIDDTKTYIISAKSGATTNTVKPGDVLSLIDKNPETLKKWKDSDQYKLLVILHDNSALMGPIRGAAFLGKLGNGFTPDNIPVMTSKNYSIEMFKTFIDQNEYLNNRALDIKKPITLDEIRRECEIIITNETTNGKVIMTQIFADAVRNEVIYIKFQVDKKSGLPKWTTIISEDIERVEAGYPAFLRSKYGHGKASDKMGIQI